jgi:hypothetical protein
MDESSYHDISLYIGAPHFDIPFVLLDNEAPHHNIQNITLCVH